jgi:type III pantothenate kinase
MLLAIDAGNTRIKWGIHSQGVWHATGSCATSEACALAALSEFCGQVRRIIVSNVAGAAADMAIREATARFSAAADFVVSRSAQCGVRSSYEHPEQLGCDRWAALIGAHHLYPGASLIVNVGTAMTVDALCADGLFLGGVIVPGLELMRRALDTYTAALRMQPGEVRFFPINTGDAIMSGAAHALAGAVERMGAFMRESGEDPLRVILSGGDAAVLRPLLALETIPVDNLVLEGLAVIAEQSDSHF